MSSSSVCFAFFTISSRFSVRSVLNFFSWTLFIRLPPASLCEAQELSHFVRGRSTLNIDLYTVNAPPPLPSRCATGNRRLVPRLSPVFPRIIHSIYGGRASSVACHRGGLTVPRRPCRALGFLLLRR